MKKLPDTTQLHFLDGHSPRPGLLGILGFPVALEEMDIEHTRFLTVQTRKTDPDGHNLNGWSHHSFNTDLVSIAFEMKEDNKAWWLLGKNGDVYRRGPDGHLDMQIQDAGLEGDGYGYLTTLRMINGTLYACGYRRQIYKYVNNHWLHCDEKVLLKTTKGEWFSDIAGTADGVLCAVGANGSIALGVKDVFSMQDTPTDVHLNAVCVDDDGMFCVAGADMTVLRGNADGFITLCTSEDDDSNLWDIEWYQGQLLVAASQGLMVVRGDTLVPFDTPRAPAHVGYKLSKVGDILWSIGEDKLLCLEGGKWTEWVCPENVE